ncbi:MAG: ferritin-like domain-containing protein [Clostridia bacterium]|nr:ferritin-like domain-containing protein [Clostridia bacterium]
MADTVIKELNALLKGIEMAIESYERYIGSVKDENIRKELQNIQLDHKRHAGDLAKHIQSLGGKPQYDTGVTGVMAGIKQTVQNALDKDPLSILRKAFEGENKGILMSQELVKGDLDSGSADLVNKILTEDQQHIAKMETLICNFENLH